MSLECLDAVHWIGSCVFWQLEKYLYFMTRLKTAVISRILTFQARFHRKFYITYKVFIMLLIVDF